MENEMNMNEPEGSAHRISGKTVLLGVAGAAAAVTLLAIARSRRYMRRYGDRSSERRDPMHFFVAGAHPLRRGIDTSGAHPLFERRQSVYDAY